MSQLSYVEKFYITHHRDEDPKELVKLLNVSITLVKNYMKYLNGLDNAEARRVKAEADKIKTGSIVPIKPDPVDNLMIKNKKRGVVVMTEAASEASDAMRSRNNTMSSRLSKNVQKIRPE